jgi:hypothetical protein
MAKADSDNLAQYIGAHVAWTVDGRSYLGTITGVDGPAFRVRHFDGSPAPDAPAAIVDVLERATNPPIA